MLNKVKDYIAIFRKNCRNKIWWKYLLVSQILSKMIFRKNDGHYVLNESWDNLIILDACRYDVFEKEIKRWNIKGDLQYRISRGTWTVPFLLENFKNINYRCDNIIYISANPYVSALLNDVFYKIIPVWDFGWDNDLKTVPPEAVYKSTLEAVRRYPNKRFIIHFIQPHEPFVSLTGKTLATGFNRLRQVVLSETSRRQMLAKHDISIWDLVEKGLVDEEVVVKAYVENLRWVMPYVIRLCKVLPGKTIITSDHGEAFGEKLHPFIPIKVYGHPDKIRIESLIKVPWFLSKESGSLDKVERELIRIKVRGVVTCQKKET